MATLARVHLVTWVTTQLFVFPDIDLVLIVIHVTTSPRKLWEQTLHHSFIQLSGCFR